MGQLGSKYWSSSWCFWQMGGQRRFDRCPLWDWYNSSVSICHCWGCWQKQSSSRLFGLILSFDISAFILSIFTFSGRIISNPHWNIWNQVFMEIFGRQCNTQWISPIQWYFSSFNLLLFLDIRYTFRYTQLIMLLEQSCLMDQQMEL